MTENERHGDVKKNRATGQKCCYQQSVRQGSLISNSKKPLLNIFIAMCMFLTGSSFKETAIHSEISERHVSALSARVRTLLAAVWIRDLKRNQIGGPGIIVEIDESVFNKRKYHRGRFIKEKWVFGGVERGGSGVFFVHVKNRRRETLLLLNLGLP